MDLTTYLDESGTHGGDLTVMAGFIAEARQWQKFEKRAALPMHHSALAKINKAATPALVPKPVPVDALRPG